MSESETTTPSISDCCRECDSSLYFSRYFMRKVRDDIVTCCKCQDQFHQECADYSTSKTWQCSTCVSKETEPSCVSKTLTIDDVKKLELRLVDVEQRLRSSHLIILNIPSDAGHPIAIVFRIAYFLGVKLENNDIEFAYRAASLKANCNPPIIVSFRTKRQQFLYLARKTFLSTHYLGFSRVNETIYVNEHLCHERNQLFKAALVAKRERNWNAVWTWNGVIKIRKSFSHDPITVSNHDELLKID